MRKAAFWLVNKRTGFLDIYRDLSRLQWRPARELEERQFQKLKELITFAHENVALYRRLMDAKGVKPNSLKSLQDINRLPIVTKSDVRAAFPRHIVAKGQDFRSGIPSFTSGSTQTPFFVYLDRAVRGIALASRVLFDSWHGIEPEEKHVDIKVFPKLVDRLLLNELQIAAFDVTTKTAERIVNRIARFSPKALSGHPSSLTILASFILESSFRLNIRPAAVFPWGETLLPQHKAMISAAFGARVSARYGAAEVGGILAQECPDGCQGYHVNTQLGILEIVDKDGNSVDPGMKGRVVVTNLHNHLMPLIRYDVGDVAIRGESPGCGRGFPLVTSFEGRTVDFVETLDGSLRPLPDFHVPPKFWPYVHQYQFEQTEPGLLKVRIVPSRAYHPEVGRDIVKHLVSLVNDMKFEVETVSEIPRESSGKRPLLKRTIN